MAISERTLEMCSNLQGFIPNMRLVCLISTVQAVVVTNCTQFSPDQQEKLLEVLTEFEDLIDDRYAIII